MAATAAAELNEENLTEAIADWTYFSERRVEGASELEEEARRADILVFVLRLVRAALRRGHSLPEIMALLQEAGHEDEAGNPWSVETLQEAMARGQKAATAVGGRGKK